MDADSERIHIVKERPLTSLVLIVFIACGAADIAEKKVAMYPINEKSIRVSILKKSLNIVYKCILKALPIY